LAGNFPKEQKFDAKCLSSDIWDQLERDLSEDNQIMAQSRGESILSKEDQLRLLKIVSTEGPNWKLVQESLNLKNRREAIIEFLRLDMGDELEKDFLFQFGKKIESITNLKEVEQYN
jgi:hypothetical protein